MIHPERIKVLKTAPDRKGRYVLYWMQASQRSEENHALEFAIREANARALPVVVFFGLTWDFPEANARHYRFMIEGLNQVRSALNEKGVQFLVRNISPEAGALELSREAALAVTDRGYLPIQKKWRTRLAQQIACPLLQVETDVVVPVSVAADKEAYNAAVFRRKIGRHIPAFMSPLSESKPVRQTFPIHDNDALEIREIDFLLKNSPVDASIPPVTGLIGGNDAAMRRLSTFIRNDLIYYGEKRNDPVENCRSEMSPYLHFGQISPLTIAREIEAAGLPSGSAYLEELIIRRELAINFVHYNPYYATYAALPEWARKTLDFHSGDTREQLYTLQDLEIGTTGDPYWNAAQKELRYLGTIHGYMRMYWGKKILEWSPSPREGFSSAVYLNNKYALDGRDPNSFAGVAWCFGKHDRPWAERPVFGKIRYMNARGLERKFDMKAYVDRIEKLTADKV